MQAKGAEMTQTIVKAPSVAAQKIAALKERKASSLAPIKVDDNGMLHIVIHPPVAAPDPLDVQLDYCFKGIRDNFKKFNTKAKYHLNSYFIEPKAEPKVINNYFNNDEELKCLMKYLNISLNDFAANLKRFLHNVKNTDYKLDIFPQDYSSPNIHIIIKNSKGRQAGPFLLTAIRQDNVDGYNRLDVVIGYVSKKRKKVMTHYFSYDTRRKAEDYKENHNSTERLKTEKQILHDEFNDLNMKELAQSLKLKHKAR